MRNIFLIAAILAITTSCCKTAENAISVVPYPNEVEIKCGSFNACGAEFHISDCIDEASTKVIENFASRLAIACGQECTINNQNPSKGFIFILDSEMSAEAYSIKVGRKVVKVSAPDLNGFNYAIQTLKQMLPVEIYGTTALIDADWSLPCCKINDAPRFGYRGMHLDVSRHFFDADAVKRYLDVMEIHKLKNRRHVTHHLPDMP